MNSENFSKQIQPCRCHDLYSISLSEGILERVFLHIGKYLSFFKNFFKKPLTNEENGGIILFVGCIADLCKGSTNDSDSFCPGSNPGSAAKRTVILKITVLFFGCFILQILNLIKQTKKHLNS